MSYPTSHYSPATRQQPSRDAARIDALLIDEEFDDFPDREISAIRESLADDRSI